MASAVAIAVVLGASPPGHAVRSDPPDRNDHKGVGSEGRPARDRTVTLVTGDRVTLVGGDAERVSVDPAAGREKVKFVTQHSAGKLLVIPSDVLTLVGSGRLDRRLFDVTGLIEAAYDDSRTRSTPLIVTYAGAAGRVSVGSSGAETVRELPSINGTAVRLTKGARVTLFSGRRLAAGLERIWLDGKRQVTLDRSVPQIGAPAAWQSGYTGKGITVAVLDTGVDNTHPDLADRVVEARNFTQDPNGDRIGHGTHVASIIAGTAAASGGRYKGVAPDAGILDAKVCGDLFCQDSAILAGLQWAAAEKHADVVNVSLGGRDTPDIDPVEEAVNTLTAQTGSLFVVAAGNDGEAGSVNSPGSADAALTVGAVDRSDELAPFSSRGPVGDGVIKPDVTAPGVDIVAARSKDGRIGVPVGDRYVRLSGTSMATPHVAGAAALLKQQHPDWTATELKSVLMSSAKQHANQTAFQQGAGRIDVVRAITQTVVSQPGSLSFGTVRWPHDDDAPIIKQVTYRNVGGTPVTLDLHASLSGPDGQPAPASAVTLSASEVTVPAGGTATVSVTSSTDHEGTVGDYSGSVVATAAGVSVTTPIAVIKEPERYDLTVKFIGPDGKPATDASTLLYTKAFAPFGVFLTPVSDGAVTIRLPRDDYALSNGIVVNRGADQDIYSLVQPSLLLTHDTVVTVDARIAKPISTSVARAGAELARMSLLTSLDFGGGAAISVGIVSQRFEGIYTAPLGSPAGPERSVTTLGSHWGVPGADRSFVNSPYVYELMNYRVGQYFHGFSRTVQDSELATVTEQYNAQVGGRRARKVTFGSALGQKDFFAYSFRYDLPARSTHLRDAGPVEWSGDLWEFVDDGLERDVTLERSMPKAFRAGQSYAERWNSAVFGPGFPQDDHAVRSGDDIFVNVPMYSDADGHAGFSQTDPGASTSLYRNGQLIAQFPVDGRVLAFGVPAEEGEFKLVSTATRENFSGMSTRIDTQWNFRSRHPTGDVEQLPLRAVRYFPPVDDRNTVERRNVTALPVRLEAQPDARLGSVTTVEVQVSGDDGVTWMKATLQRTGDYYLAVFPTPAGSHVSLKAKVVDSDGNVTGQTIIRAFQLR